MANPEELFDVEVIAAARRIGRSWEYYIKWVGYPPEEDSWEPEVNLKVSCKWVLERFWDHVGRHKRKKAKSSTVIRARPHWIESERKLRAETTASATKDNGCNTSHHEYEENLTIQATEPDNHLKTRQDSVEVGPSTENIFDGNVGHNEPDTPMSPPRSLSVVSSLNSLFDQDIGRKDETQIPEPESPRPMQVPLPAPKAAWRPSAPRKSERGILIYNPNLDTAQGTSTKIRLYDSMRADQERRKLFLKNHKFTKKHASQDLANSDTITSISGNVVVSGQSNGPDDNGQLPTELGTYSTVQPVATDAPGFDPPANNMPNFASSPEVWPTQDVTLPIEVAHGTIDDKLRQLLSSCIDGKRCTFSVWWTPSDGTAMCQGDQTREMVSRAKGWGAQDKEHGVVVDVMLVHIGALSSLHTLPSFGKMRTEGTAFYVYGSYPDVPRSKWGIREIYPCGGIVMFTPRALLQDTSTVGDQSAILSFTHKVRSLAPMWTAMVQASHFGAAMEELLQSVNLQGGDESSATTFLAYRFSGLFKSMKLRGPAFVQGPSFIVTRKTLDELSNGKVHLPTAWTIDQFVGEMDERKNLVSLYRSVYKTRYGMLAEQCTRAGTGDEYHASLRKDVAHEMRGLQANIDLAFTYRRFAVIHAGDEPIPNTCNDGVEWLDLASLFLLTSLNSSREQR